MPERDEPPPSKDEPAADAQSGRATRRAAQTQTGLTALDLLSEALPPPQRLLIGWLARRKPATLSEVSDFWQARGQAAQELQPTLDAMLEKGLLRQAIVAGEVRYRVVFQGRAQRTGVGLPSALWERVDQDRVSFLSSLALFRRLAEAQLRALADQMDEVRYQRGDVLVWQGKSNDRVFIIKSGIVAITHYSADAATPKILNYLQQGEIIGEYSAISGSVPSATATALSTVYALSLKREAFLALLEQHASVALELARILAARLVKSEGRARAESARLIVLIEAQAGVGASDLGMALALSLAAKLGGRIAYTHMPRSQRLAELFGLDDELDTFAHAAGYDVIARSGNPLVPPSVCATLMADQLLACYEHVVISASAQAEDLLSYLSGYADQIVLVGAPTAESAVQIVALGSALRRQVSAERVGLFSVLRETALEKAEPIGISADFILPHDPAFAAHLALTPDDLPEAIRHFAATLVDRLGRTNAISLYIPTTIDVNATIDATPYVERTLAFLGERFGGATTTALQARGVWNSAEVGLVGESIHIVRSYASQADLNAHLPSIFDYVEALKRELRQEAMAIEINQKLMLI